METLDSFLSSVLNLKGVRSSYAKLTGDTLELAVIYHGIGFNLPVQAQRRYFNGFISRVFTFIQSNGDTYGIKSVRIENVHNTQVFRSGLLRADFHIDQLRDRHFVFIIPDDWYVPPIEKMVRR